MVSLQPVVAEYVINSLWQLPLLAAGADAHIRNAKGWAPVHSGAAAGHLEAVLRLVAAGAAPRSRPDLDVLRMLTRKTTYRCGQGFEVGV